MRPIDLRAEYSPDRPLLTLDEPSPRLSWLLQSDRAGAAQSAYRVRAASSVELLRADKPDLWDSGKINSDDQSQIELRPSRPLASRQRVCWDVQVWDEQGKEGEPSEVASFEMGLLRRDDWTAQFVEVAELLGSGRSAAHVPVLRQTFTLPAGVKQARLYITALGLYEATINGARVTADALRPGWTDYRKRLAYLAYDVTPQLRAGENTIDVLLGDGWYCGRVAHLDRAVLYSGERPALVAQIECELADGSTKTIVTDGAWRWHASSTLGADLLAGEQCDARQMHPKPGEREDAWRPVRVREWPASIKLEISPAPPVRQTQELSPVAAPKQTHASWGHRAFVYDFGQNLVGVVRLSGRAPKGCTLVIRHAEALKPDGSIDTSNLRGVEASDHYTFAGDDDGETWQPRFTFHGFRYVEISFHESYADQKRPNRLDVESLKLTAVVLGSDTPFHSSFETGHAFLDKLFQNVLWGQRGNFLEVPTDCPQRDERLGWTGDTQIFASTAACNAEVASFFTKWMRDVDDAQFADGQVPNVVPTVGDTYDGGPGWSDAVVVVPWTVYQATGDKRILQRSLDAIRKWGDWQISTAPDGRRATPGSIPHLGYGDWLALEGSDGIQAWHNLTPKDLIGTAYHAYSMGVASKVARVVGDAETAERFAAARARAVDAFNRYYVTPAGTIAVPSQTAHLMALAYDLLPEAVRPRAFEALLKLFEARQWHLATGFLGTPLICPVLTRFGRPDLAYRVLLQESYPGWLYPVTIGATTMWERWNSWSPEKGFVEVGMNSLNHYAYGAVGEWMIETIGGIALDPAHPGGAKVTIAPIPHEKITHAAAARRFPRGTVRTRWSRSGEGRFELDVELPPNMSATVLLPGASAAQTIGSGRHRLVSA
jgi:alpha-L-rhamnosidase